MLRALIFDLDGTLIDSLADLAEAVNRMLDERGHARRPLELFPEFIGDGMRRLIERALPEDARSEVSVAAAMADYQRHYAALWRDKTMPYPGIPEVLQTLRQHGIRTACISNKPDHFTRLCCAHFFPGQLEAVYGQRSAVPRKPDPAAALECAAELGVSLAECAYLGDSGVDMEFAKRSGMKAIGVTWGFRSREELIDRGADVLLDQPSQILSLKPHGSGQATQT